MKPLGEYIIAFEGLKQGTHHFEFEVDNKFFETFDCFEFNSSAFKVDLELEKRSTMLLLEFSFTGSFTVPCDRCLDDVEMPLSGAEKLIVKFGSDNYTDTDDILILPDSEHEINVAANIYEFIMLHVPQKRVHEKGKCNQNVIDALSKVEQKEEQHEDPRWASLKDINLEK
ncbi:MAG: DUF177 domain-containing protein [Flavobacteriales bacterium]|nr:DUF177 domain-containing protein [Flavobacteriales bacterium]